ncbi:glucosamine-6-phosphate deaminase [Microbacterium hydrocarbonoxydans]|uniref:glucosamine-6-phosphate deaminase n=1 Tax=Microbacterium hydrocarbonoxydans TaxID=273678 RepID=UPI00203EAD27|nr:glucosamine-6-phosphate deaminase [Microbacterium hydrocarbonoxydans]MCM3778592.1 glucosamine-6-phosphate deaminase [Microbacterium hydrocarbonoxydans]
MTDVALRKTVAATYPTAAAAASATVDVIEELLRAGRLRNLGVATGSSPSPVYGEMARRRLDLSEVTLFALDEYIGLPAGHPESYRAVVEREIAVPLGVPSARVHLPDGHRPEAYDGLIAAHGGIDLQILGIGRNGHIGFNEPGSSFRSRTRVVDLAPATREANSRFFDSPDDVPRRSVTQGIGTIMEARRLVVVASGDAKAAAVAAAMEGPRTEDVPASVLREHPDVAWFLDRAAASQLASRAAREEGVL